MESIEVFDPKRYEHPVSKAAIPRVVPHESGLLLLYFGEELLFCREASSIRLELERSIDIPAALEKWIGFTHFSFIQCSPEFMNGYKHQFAQYHHPPRVERFYDQLIGGR